MSEAFLIRGGSVVTMDAERRVLEGDVLIESGVITAVGKKATDRAKGHGAVHAIDASGCAVVPGLVQAHVHLCQALFRGMADELPLMRWLRERIWPLEGAHDARSLGASARLGLCEMLRAGTTSILDMGTVREQDAVFEAMRESGIRGLSGKAMMDAGQGVPRGLRETRKASIDESLALFDRWNGRGDRLGYAFAPRFILSCSERLLRETAEAARERRAIVHTHAAEHPGERSEVRAAYGVDDVVALERMGIAGERAVLAHGVQLTKPQMRALGKLGTRVVHCPSANLKLASGIADVVAMREAGIVVGIGADGAPCNNRLDPWTELREAALLAKVKREDAAALAAVDALAMMTIDGARVLGLADRVGSIEAGKRGDVIVVDLEGAHALPGGDPMTRLVYSCTAADVREVFADGRWVVRHGELTTLDEARAREDAKAEAKKILRRAKL